MQCVTRRGRIRLVNSVVASDAAANGTQPDTKIRSENNAWLNSGCLRKDKLSLLCQNLNSHLFPSSPPVFRIRIPVMIVKKRVVASKGTSATRKPMDPRVYHRNWLKTNSLQVVSSRRALTVSLLYVGIVPVVATNVKTTNEQALSFFQPTECH